MPAHATEILRQQVDRYDELMRALTEMVIKTSKMPPTYHTELTIMHVTNRIMEMMQKQEDLCLRFGDVARDRKDRIALGSPVAADDIARLIFAPGEGALFNAPKNVARTGAMASAEEKNP